MAKAEKANEIEVTREARIKALAAKLQKAEDDKILAEATKQIEAEEAAEAEAARLKAEDEANAKARAEAGKVRAAYIKGFSALVGGWLVENDSDSPQSIPGAVIEALRNQAASV